MTQAVADPTLSILSEYFAAFINRYGAEAWASVAPATPQPVTTIWTHRPEDVVFNEKQLPALYLYRTVGRGTDQIAQDWYVATSTLQLVWVFPPHNQATRRVRAPWVNAVVKLVNDAIERMRDPAYVMTGDADPTAPLRGSRVFVLANLHSMRLDTWSVGTTEVQKGEDKAEYPSVTMSLAIEERDEAYATGFDSPYGLEYSVVDPNGIAWTDKRVL